MNVEAVQLALGALNVLVLPAPLGVSRWLIRVELRLSRIEWKLNPDHQPGSKP